MKRLCGHRLHRASTMGRVCKAATDCSVVLGGHMEDPIARQLRHVFTTIEEVVGVPVEEEQPSCGCYLGRGRVWGGCVGL